MGDTANNDIVPELPNLPAGNIYTMPITDLYGVGRVRASMYNKLGVFTVWDLLCHIPRAYENRGDISSLETAPPDKRVSVLLTVATSPKSAKIQAHMLLTKFRAFDDSGICEITYFNQPYVINKFQVGETFRFWGKIERRGSFITMSSPAAEPYDENKPLPDFYPVYRLTNGLSSRQISKDMERALSAAALSLHDELPSELMIKNKLPTLAFALNTIHSPQSYEALAAAKRRLVYDELLSFALGMRLSHEKKEKTDAFPCKDTNIDLLLREIGFELTAGQKSAIEDIQRDMSQPVKMNRMLVGDVGCGKTVCAAAAIYIAVKNGRQAALMVPTEILAIQHYKDLSALFSKLGIRCELLTGSVTPANKRKIYNLLSEKNPSLRIDVIIGTHALLTDGTELALPGIVITDEQHRFGVRQRAALSQKNAGAHLLVMSATPIPRSLALTIYGDLDVSQITDMPPGRSRVDTFVVDESYRGRLDAFISRLVADDGQVYIVCPSIDELETDEENGEVSIEDICPGKKLESRPKPKAAVTYAAELAARLPNINVGFIHGKLKNSEKDDIMYKFFSGKIDVLVSTTVIEVGVNVPNACLMVVENAERFGLSQLHQLRGRVGRGNRKSYCILVSECIKKNIYGRSETGNALKRLETMKSLYDGYKIAEQDLYIRGPGDFFASLSSGGMRQSGGMRFKLASLCDDTKLLNAATEDAVLLLSEDPGLEKHKGLKAQVDRMFSVDADTVN